MTVRLPPGSSVGPRRKRLTVIVREVLPPYPNIGDEVGVILGGRHAIRGWVLQRVGMDAFRIELDPEAEL